MKGLQEEFADNAPNGNGCNITPTAVSPRMQRVTVSGNRPITVLSEGKWECMEQNGKKTVIKEHWKKIVSESEPQVDRAR